MLSRSQAMPKLDEAVVVALRIMEERLNLIRRMAREARQQNREAIAEMHEARAVEYARYVDVLRQAAARSIGAV